MAKLTNKFQDNVKVYEVLTDVAEKKVLAFADKFNIDKFRFEKKIRSSMVFYDTKDNLFTTTGILLYKTFEDGEYYFKIEKLNFLPSITKFTKTEVFEHKVTAKDTPKTVAFYLINGITSLFSTTFNIDLENVVKVAFPKLVVDIEGTSYKGVKGNGFRVSVEFLKVIYNNLVTRKRRENNELSVINTSSQQFDKDFAEFLTLFEKYCKDVLPKNETRFDFGKRITNITREAMKIRVKEKKEKEKDIRIEDKIED